MMKLKLKPKAINMRLILLAATMLIAVSPASADPRGIYRPDQFDYAKKDVRTAAKNVAKDREEVREVLKVKLEPDEEIKWLYNITMLHSDGGTGHINVHATPYGMYASEAECKWERAVKIAGMETEIDKDGKPSSAPVTKPLQEWRMITPGTVLTDTYSNSSYERE